MKSLTINLIKPDGEPTLLFGEPVLKMLEAIGLLIRDEEEVRHISIDVREKKMMLFLEAKDARGT